MSIHIKEEYAIVLDFLPNGYPFDTRPTYKKTPIAQAIGKEHFTLLELVPKKINFSNLMKKYIWAKEKGTKFTI